MTKPFDHINFSSTLSKAFKSHMLAKLGINPDNVCYKAQDNEQLSTEARIVMACWVTYEECKATTLLTEMRALTAESTLAQPNCYWNDLDEDGETFGTLEDLLDAYKEKADKRYALFSLGRSVQIDNSYVVVDYKTDKVTLHASKESAKAEYLHHIKHELIMTQGSFQLPTPKRKTKK